MKQVYYRWANKDFVGCFIDDMPYLFSDKWHPTDFKVKITIEKIKETKK